MVGEPLPQQVHRLSKELSDREWWVRNKAAESLGELGPAASEVFLKGG